MKCFKMMRKAERPKTHNEDQWNSRSEPQFEGVVFDDGTCVVRWLTGKRSTTIWKCFEDMMAIHGHPEYDSEIIWYRMVETHV